MRNTRTIRRSVALSAVLAAISTLPVAAVAQSRTYPPGTDCANQPTIAERLLCGREELQRQQDVSVEEPVGTPQTPDPFPEPPAPPTELRMPAPQQERQPLTASPRH